MIGILWQFTLIFISCIFGANIKNSFNKRSQVPWFQERVIHEGMGLSDLDLKKISNLGDEIHFNNTLNNIAVERVVDTLEHTQVQNYMINQLEKLGLTVETHSFDDSTPIGTKTFTNILATLNPSATRRLVLDCHYDSKYTPKGFLGATDSAVPCSMLINLAFVMRNYLDKHKQEVGRSNLTLQFIFFDGEEAFVNWTDTDSLYGSRKLASKLHATSFPPGHETNELNRIDLFVLLDLIGTEDCRFANFYPDTKRWYGKLSEFEKRLTFLRLINHRTPMFRNEDSYRNRIKNDHIPFFERGVPILHLIAYPFPSVWHKMSDNMESLHPPSIQNMNTLLRVFVTDYLHLQL
ncbi:Glutaminyl-peptide cyclotransferase [Armadillidium nasatum]|uniref:Glutaminyl-peptide cyclotransferase n=1 Tax=Armadillidium nasatum TaxID=96803 RepID=A0A5N5T8Z1_9CRUS|nr:Glutaminyl-peptide cyclotransferase [Armadillidium nasatum]